MDSPPANKGVPRTLGCLTHPVTDAVMVVLVPVAHLMTPPMRGGRSDGRREHCQTGERDETGDDEILDLHENSFGQTCAARTLTLNGILASMDDRIGVLPRAAVRVATMTDSTRP